MSADSDIQDSIDKTREAFRRVPAPSGGPFSSPEQRRREATDDDTQEERATAALHPFFRGLLNELPAPGADWPPAKREQWLETARHIFALIYADPAENRGGIRLVDTQRDMHQADRPFQQSA